MYSIGNIVNTIVITVYGDRWQLDLHGDYFVLYKDIEPLDCISEPNIIFEVKKEKKITVEDFPGGPVDTNLPAGARGHGFGPWSGKISHAVVQLSLRTAAAEPACCNYTRPQIEPTLPYKRSEVQSLSHVQVFVTPRTVVCTLLCPWVLQATIQWVTIPFAMGSSQSRDRTQVSHTAGGFFIIWLPGKPTQQEKPPQ